MRKPLNTVRTWGRKTWLVLQAFEAALDYRYQDHAEDRFARLERRITALEHQTVPDARKSQ